MKSIGIIKDDKGETQLQGDIILLVSVNIDADTYDGKISSDDDKVDGFDYLTLARVVMEQCFRYAAEKGLKPELCKTTLTSFINEMGW